MDLKILLRLPLICCLIGLWFTPVANAMVFLAPKASAEDFAKHLVQKNQLSYTQWFMKNESGNPTAVNPKVSEFVEKSLNKSFTNEAEQLLAWEQLRLSENLQLLDRELLLLLAEKIGNVPEICRMLLLEPALEKNLEQSQKKPKCTALEKPLPKDFIQSLERNDVVSVDGKLFPFGQIPSHLVSGKYHWKIFSNRFVDREFTADITDLAKALQPGAPWADGTCDSFKVAHPDFAVVTQASVYFDDACIPRAAATGTAFGLLTENADQDSEEKHWLMSKKSWFWSVGILVAGATAYSLRDKELIITK